MHLDLPRSVRSTQLFSKVIRWRWDNCRFRVLTKSRGYKETTAHLIIPSYLFRASSSKWSLKRERPYSNLRFLICCAECLAGTSEIISFLCLRKGYGLSNVLQRISQSYYRGRVHGFCLCVIKLPLWRTRWNSWKLEQNFSCHWNKIDGVKIISVWTCNDRGKEWLFSRSCY